MPVDLPIERAYGTIKATISANVGWSPVLETEIREALRGLERAYMGSVRAPLEARLLAWIRDHEGLVASHRQIADEVHSTRESVTRRLKGLRLEGVVWRQRVSSTGGRGLPRWGYGLVYQQEAA